MPINDAHSLGRSDGRNSLAQVGKGLLDFNVAAKKDLVARPHMTAAIVKGLMEKRPFMSIVDLHA